MLSSRQLIILKVRNSSTVTAKSTGAAREQLTKATIDNGTIATGIDSYSKDETGRLIVAVQGTTNGQFLAGLNRDTNNTK